MFLCVLRLLGLVKPTFLYVRSLFLFFAFVSTTNDDGEFGSFGYSFVVLEFSSIVAYAIYPI